MRRRAAERIGEMPSWVSLFLITALIAAISGWIFAALFLASLVVERRVFAVAPGSVRGCRGD